MALITSVNPPPPRLLLLEGGLPGMRLLQRRGPLDLISLLAELRAEAKHINEAIVVIEHLVLAGGKRRRGRPPKLVTKLAAKSTYVSNASAQRREDDAAD